MVSQRYQHTHAALNIFVYEWEGILERADGASKRTGSGIHGRRQEKCPGRQEANRQSNSKRPSDSRDGTESIPMTSRLGLCEDCSASGLATIIQLSSSSSSSSSSRSKGECRGGARGSERWAQRREGRRKGGGGGGGGSPPSFSRQNRAPLAVENV